jgi:hypothetical protein
MKAFHCALGMVCALAAFAAGAGASGAQGWGWGNRGNAYDSPSSEQPQRPVYGQPYGSQQGYGAPQNQTYGSANPRCRDLEAQLTGGAAAAGQDQLPRIESETRQADAQYHRAQADAERLECYDDMFLFGRSLRRTPRCVDLDRQVQAAKAQLTQLKAQRDAIMRGSSPRGRRDDIVAELARNRCGDQYVREHDQQRSRNQSVFSFFNDEDNSDESPRFSTSTTSYGGSSSTYRTLCVRECDGFYFPVSNATTEAQFKDDEAKCHSQCAGPAELYYHRSDQDVDQMVSLSGRPYASMPFAFRNRKVYIKGCSCNAAEYSREEIAKSEEALKLSKRADASAGKAASDAAFARRMSQAVQHAPQAPAAPAPGEAPPAPPQEPAPPR